MTDILIFALVGFAAQIVDGALGMAYGVSATTLLLSVGVSPSMASASIHTAEVFTTAASGISHLRLGNVNRDLVVALLIPGVIGGVVGAYILTNLPTDIIKPIISVYLLLMGLVILFRAIRKAPEKAESTSPRILALVGGFCDAIGGGGWGPIVTSTLVARGLNPRFTIGSVNATEFFVTAAEAITFFATIGAVLLENWQTIAGLLIGGVIAAPLGAYFCKRLPTRTLMILVGVLIALLSLRTIIMALSG
jgi:uncharacterized membrane protein YfcA